MPRPRILELPSPSLVVMIGAAGSGKSSFCRRNFTTTQIVSSDACRALLTDDAANQEVSTAAFDLAHRIIAERLRRRRLTVLDATSLETAARAQLLRIAAEYHLPAIAIILDLPLGDCLRHDRDRPDRRVGRAVIARQWRALQRALPRLREESFAILHRIRSSRAAASTRVAEAPLRCDRRAEVGPFDIIGDVHGCARELVALLTRLGYERRSPRAPFRHAEGRRVVLLGDLVNRGPEIIATARIVMDMVERGEALCVPGNRDDDLARLLAGEPGAPEASTLISLRQMRALRPEARRRFASRFSRFAAGLPSHLILDGGRLVVAHAGMKRGFAGRDSETVRRFALRGETTGEVGGHGSPVPLRWPSDYTGRVLVVYGHKPVATPAWIYKTVNIDTGCVYGGALTALRYPELTLVAVPAGRTYYRRVNTTPNGFDADAGTGATPAN